MVNAQEDFLDLMRRVQEGDGPAAQELYEHYREHILRVVRRRLHQPLRSRYDSCDLEQSVWASFFDRATKTCRFDSPQALVAYLRKMALFKVVDAYRQAVQASRNGRAAERPLHDGPDGSGEGGPQGHLAAPSPTPSQEAVAREHWEQLLTEGRCELDRRILTMRREGYTHEEIGQVLGLSPKRVQRLLRRLDAGRPT